MPQSLDGPDLKFVFKSGNYSTIMTQENKKLIEEIASKFSGHSFKLIFDDSNVLTRLEANNLVLLIQRWNELQREEELSQELFSIDER